MASAFRRGRRWIIKFKDARGRWCTRSSSAQTKTEAKRLAVDLERKAERQRLRLEVGPFDETLTLGALLSRWETAHFRHTEDYGRSRGTFQTHDHRKIEQGF